MKHKKEKTVPHNIATEAGRESITKKKADKPLLKRWWFWLGAGVTVFLLLLTFALPFGAKQYAIDWLKKNGIEQAVVKRFGWNPFTGRLWLDGVNLAHNGQTVMEQGSLDINVSYTSLFSKDIALSSASYSGLVLEVEQKEDGSWLVASLIIPSSAEKKADADNMAGKAMGKAKDAETKEIVAQGDGKKARQQVSDAWAFLADNVSIKDCRIRYKTPVFDFTLHIDSAELKRLSTREKSPAGTFVLQGKVNGKPVTINLEKVTIAPTLRLAGKIEVSSFELDSLDTLLHDSLPFWGGNASLSGDMDFSIADSGMDVKYNGSITVAKADVGADSFRTRADSLGWQGAVHYAMPANAAMKIITDGVLQADGYSLQVAGAELDTSEKLVELSGKTTVDIGDKLLVEHSGKLIINTIAFALPNLQIMEDSFVWNGDVRYQMTEAHQVDTKGELALGSLAVESGTGAERISALAKALGWRGAVSFSQPDKGDAALETDGVLSGDDTKVKLYGENLSISEESLKLSSKTRLHFGDMLDVNGDSSLTAGRFTLGKLGEKEPMVALESLVINKLAGLGGKKIAAQSLIAKKLAVRTEGDLPLDITVPDIRLQSFSSSNLENFTFSALALKEPRIVALYNEKELLAIDDIAFADIAVDTGVAGGGAMAVKSLAFDNLSFLRGAAGQSGASLKQAKLKGIHLSPKEGFRGDYLDFIGFSSAIIRDDKGEINLARQLAAMRKSGDVNGMDNMRNVEKTAKSQKKASKKEPKAAFPVRLGRVHISGDSHIGFQDHTLKVPYTTNLAIDELSLTELDSSRPQNKSPFKLSATLEGRAPLTVAGNIQPFLEDIGLDLSINLKNYPLKNLAPYTIQSIGVGLASGELRVESSVLLEKKKLKNANTLLLRSLETETISKKLAAELDNKLPVPFDTALFLLRDDNGNIKLSVPLNGKLDDLHVGLEEVIVTALEKAVVPALTGYAIYALGPYGALAYAGMKLGEDLLKEKDLPLIFMPGDAVLVAQQKKTLEPLGKTLQKEKKDMQIHPVVASWELMGKKEIQAISGKSVPVVDLSPEIRQQLDELGQSRAKNIQQYFIEQYGIDKDRLLLGTTIIKEEKKMLPLVILHKVE